MSTLNDYCLHAMGITQWQLKSASTYDYLLFLNESLDLSKNQLIERILLALGWSGAASKIEILPSQDPNAFFCHKINQYQPKKVLLFDETFNLTLNTKDIALAILPSLHELMINIDAKRKAWEIMQAIR